MDGNKRKKIIIAILIIAIVALSGIFAFDVFRHREPTSATPATTAAGESTQIGNDELDALLSAQPLYTNGVKYYYASSSPQLAHDAMGATVFNNSDLEVKSFTLAFCAFDEADNPIQIEQPDETNKAAYIRLITYDLSTSGGEKTAILPGESFDNVVFYVKNEPQIVTIKACVKSFVSTDNVTWNNPYYETFKNNYAGKSLQTAEQE